VRMALFVLVLGVEDDVEGSLEPVKWSRPSRSRTLDPDG